MDSYITFEDIPGLLVVMLLLNLYLAVFATAIALLLQKHRQKYTKPPASIILSLRRYLVLCSLYIYKEKITIKLLRIFTYIYSNITS